MSWSQKHLLIALLMVVTGSLNTLTTKWADKMSSEGSDGVVRSFNHPFVQATAMFFGELLCLIAFKVMLFYKRRRSGELGDVVPLIQGNPDFNPVIFLPPALCDMLATSIMYVGLNMTFASSFQMLRGSVIVFTGIFSMLFLEKILKSVQWFGILTIMVGLGLVGLADVLFPSKNGESHDRNSLITGDLLIILAQIISACQMTYEEKFINKHNVPALAAVGWEGLFGFSVLSVLLIPMYFIPMPTPFGHEPRFVLEDAIDAFTQLHNNPLLVVAFTGTIVSIAFFNFAGISVTKELSATTRMVLDSLRTLVIWIVSLCVQWQAFNYLQLIGFLILICGMCLYNNILIAPTLTRWGIIPRPRADPPVASFNTEPIT